MTFPRMERLLTYALQQLIDDDPKPSSKNQLAEVCLLGTSLTRQHNSFAGGVHVTGGNGIWNWANWMIGSPVDFSQNLGISGDIAESIFSRIHQIRPELDNVIVDCMTNNILGFSSSANPTQIAAEIERLVGTNGILPRGLKALKAMGKSVTVITTPPNNAFNSPTDSRIQLLDAVNSWITNIGPRKYIDNVVDVFSVMWDNTQPTLRVFKTNYSTDGTHLSNRGAFAGGKLAKDALQAIYERTYSRSNKYYNYNNSIGILSQMRTVPGISSTISFGTGTLASGWRSLNSGTGNAPTLVLSQVPYTENPDYIGPNSLAIGIDEKWQKLVITNTDSGNVVRIQLAADITNNSDPGISAGDMFFVTCEVMVQNPVNLNLISVRGAVSFVNGTTPVDQSYSSSSAQVRTLASQSSVSGTEYAYEEGFRVLMVTIPVRVPENISASTPIAGQMIMDASFNGVGSADVYYARPCFWRKQA